MIGPGDWSPVEHDEPFDRVDGDPCETCGSEEFFFASKRGGKVRIWVCVECGSRTTMTVVDTIPDEPGQ